MSGSETEAWTTDGSPPVGRRLTHPRLSRGTPAVALPCASVPDTGAGPLPTQSHAACSTNARLYVHGGLSGEAVPPQLWLLQGREWSVVGEGLHSQQQQQQAASAPCAARYGHTLTLVCAGSRLVMVGGCTADGALQRSLCVFDLAAPGGGWRVHATDEDAFEPVVQHSAVLCGGGLVLCVFGGAAAGTLSNAVQRFDLEEGRWVSGLPATGDVPAPRCGHTAHSYARLDGGESMYVFGGRVAGDPARCSNELFDYDVRGREWAKVYTGGQVPCARAGHASTCVRDQMLVFGGGCGEEVYEDCHYLNMVTNTWRRVRLRGESPGPRRFHTANLVEEGAALSMVVFGGVVAPPAHITNVASILTVGVGPRSRHARPRRPQRPRTAPGAGRTGDGAVRGTAKSHGRARYNTERGAGGGGAGAGVGLGARQPQQPGGEPPPWSVTTCRATTARSFGDYETPDTAAAPWRLREAPTLPSSTIDSIITRLSDTRPTKLAHQTLADRHLFQPTKARRLASTRAMDEYNDRMYHQQVELRELYQRNLEYKYFPTKEPPRIRTEVVQDMVQRLNKAPVRKDPSAPDERAETRKVVDLKQSVGRLFYDSVERQRERRSELRARYVFANESPRITLQQVDSLVDRLYRPVLPG